MSTDDRLVTFDCFDTVLTRASGSARATTQVVAHEVRRRGLLHDDVAVVASARRRAEDLSWHEAGDTATLTDVWTVATDLLHADGGLVPDLVRAELDVERRVLHAVPGAAERVRGAKESGARVGFLSDTLLSSDFVGERLRAAGVWVDGGAVWVSNELGASKDRGGAYLAVARSLGGMPSSWVHHGDSDRSDGTVARRSGVRAELLPAARFNRYEAAMDATASGTAGLAGLMAGAARLARLGAAGDPTTVRVVTGLASPLLLGFALWSLRLAERGGHVQVAASGAAAGLLDGVLRRVVEHLGLALVVGPPLPGAASGVLQVVVPGTGARHALVLGLWEPDGPPAADEELVYLPVHPAGERGRVPTQSLEAVLAAVSGPGSPGAALVSAYVEHVLDHVHLVNPWLDVREGLLDALAALWLSPSRAEALLLTPPGGCWPAADLVTAAAPVRAALGGLERFRRGRARLVRAGRVLAVRHSLRRGTVPG